MPIYFNTIILISLYLIMNYLILYFRLIILDPFNKLFIIFFKSIYYVYFLKLFEFL